MLGRQRAKTGATAGKGIFTATLALAFGLAALLASGPALARHHAGAHRTRGPVNWANVSLTDPNKDAALIMDGVSGRVLYARNAHALRHPASLTKMMTLYMLFDSIKHGQTSMQTMMPVSEHAAIQHPTKLYLHTGDAIDVDDAIKAVVVLSANDVAVTIAEYLGGTEDHFGELMTQKARELGMNDTFYHNASGLPDDRQISTASDLAILARHLAYDFPQYFHYFSTTGFVYRGRYYRGHDNLLGRYDGADGIKTGYTESSGFNLVSSVTRGGTQIIGVVMGGRTAHMRDTEMMRLLDNTYAQIAMNPNMVARRNIPWQVVAMNNPPAPIAAGFPVARSAAGNDPDDEDAAESRPDPNDAIGNLIAATPAPMPNVGGKLAAAAAVPPPPPMPKSLPVSGATGSIVLKAPPPNLRPKPAPRGPLLVASLTPTRQPPPSIRPSSRAEALGEGDIGDMGTPVRSHPATNIAKSVTQRGMRDWTIQIGAFGDAPSAKQQLAAYAERSMDVLGQAERIVVPFQSVDGKTLYRARFGPFVEAEARAVCQRMTERKQTCFAAATK
ncbi:MAG TPA: SPOR domain-containing protein [Rhizomicrobium sp.]|nr:SPOR domain-containing protein [Rhizomicrobium sp.]